MKNPTTIPEACKDLVDIIDMMAKDVGQKNIHAKSIGMADEDGCDPCVNLMVLANGKEYHTGYMITPFIEQKAVGLCDKQVDYVRYYVQHEEFVAGVYRYSDGSGEPDSTEIVDDYATDSIYDAAKKVILLNIEHELDHLLESLSEAAMANEDELYE